MAVEVEWGKGPLPDSETPDLELGLALSLRVSSLSY